MKTFNQYDVVVVPFPFTEKLASKRRPAIVISHPESMGEGRLILAMVTSSQHEPWPQDVLVRDIEAAGLTIPCRIRFKVFTLDCELIVRTLGHLSKQDKASVQSSLRKVFTLEK